MKQTTSIYLDLVRPLAALAVLLSHVSGKTISDGQLGLFSGIGGEAVDVFFVLSGFIIAFVCDTRETTPRSYVQSRVIRICSVAYPAIIATMLLDHIGLAQDPASYTGPYQGLPPGVVARSLTFLGEQWTTHRFPGSDEPYWSLGFEVWYYVAFGAFIFAPARWRWPAAATALVIVGPKVAVLFPVWLFGVAAYRACRRPITARAGWAMLLAPVVLLIPYQFFAGEHVLAFANFDVSAARLFATWQDYYVGALFAVHLVGFNRVAEHFTPLLTPFRRSIRWVAGGTFSLYLIHLPTLIFVSAFSPWPKNSPWTLLLLLTATPAICLAFAEVTERRKSVWHRAVNRLLRPFEPRRVPT